MWKVCPSRLKPSAALLGLLFATVLVPTARSEEPKLSISGYDPVAYFTDGKPVQGKSEIEYLWHKLRWRFANGEHRELFVKDPDRYAPQYDGYCAMGVAWADPHKDTVDPEAWAIVDGKLYLTHTPRSLDAWRENAAENIKTANENWSTVKNLAGRRKSSDRRVRSSPALLSSRSATVGERSSFSDNSRATRAGMSLARATCGRKSSRSARISKPASPRLGRAHPDIIKTGAYVTDMDAFLKNADMRAALSRPGIADQHRVKVDRLAGPDFLVEMEAIATVN